AFKGHGQNHFEHDHDGWQHGGDRMPDWARELRHEMNEWRRDMERDMQSLRQRMGGGDFGGGRWSVRTPQSAPQAPRMLRLRSGAAPRTWVGHFSLDEGGRYRTFDVDELQRHFTGQHGHFSDPHGEGRAERHEVHVGPDGQRVERRFRGVRNGDGWDWTPMDGGAHAEIEVEIDRAVERALRVRPEVRRNGQEIEVEVHVEHEHEHEHEHDGHEQHGHGQQDHGGVDGEIEALKRRLDELEAQRAELRERLKELKKRR
ncbi:MAG: coiled-coil domain-containing protein, partial [Planctomycetota bacterium]